jgi:hypothetical protein
MQETMNTTSGPRRDAVDFEFVFAMLFPAERIVFEALHVESPQITKMAAAAAGASGAWESSCSDRGERAEEWCHQYSA